VIASAGLSVTAAALQMSRPALSSLLNSKAGLSGEMALRIEKDFGVD
jgi:plasmid maintenance system antidote protein VapI